MRRGSRHGRRRQGRVADTVELGSLFVLSGVEESVWEVVGDATMGNGPKEGGTVRCAVRLRPRRGVRPGVRGLAALRPGFDFLLCFNLFGLVGRDFLLVQHGGAESDGEVFGADVLGFRRGYSVGRALVTIEAKQVDTHFPDKMSGDADKQGGTRSAGPVFEALGASTALLRRGAVGGAALHVAGQSGVSGQQTTSSKRSGGSERRVLAALGEGATTSADLKGSIVGTTANLQSKSRTRGPRRKAPRVNGDAPNAVVPVPGGDDFRDVFRSFDADFSGLISGTELRRAMPSAGEDGMDDDSIRATLRDADENRDGQLDYREFVKIIIEGSRG